MIRKPCVAIQPTNRTRLLGSGSQCTARARCAPDSSGLSNNLRGHRWEAWDGPRQPQSDMCGQHIAQINSERHAAVRVLYGLSLSDDTAWDSEIESLTSLDASLIELDLRKTRRRHRVTAALAPSKSCLLPDNANLHASSASLKHGLPSPYFVE